MLFDSSRHKTLRGFISLFAALCLVFSLAALPAQAFADTDEGASAGSSAIEQTTESGVDTATDDAATEGTAADEGESEADLPGTQGDEVSEMTESDDATVADPALAEEAVSTQSDATVGVEPASVEVEPAALPEHEPLVTDVVSYDVSTDHYGEWVDGLDLQVVKASLTFDKPVTMLDKDLLGAELTAKMNSASATYFANVADAEAAPYSASPSPRFVIDSLSADGKTLNLRVYMGFAAYAGHLYVESPASGLTQLVYTDDPSTSPAANIHCIVPNGLTTETVSATPATEDTPASTVTKFIAPQVEGNHVTRGMVHIMVLKNGVPIGDTLNSNWATLTTHWHDYQNLTVEQYLGMAVSGDGTGGWFGTALSDDYVLSVSGDELTITAKDSEPGDVLEVQVSSYLNNGSVELAKDALNQAIAAGQALLAGGAPAGKEAEFADLQNAIALGQTSTASPYFSQSVVDAKAAMINAAILAFAPVAPPTDPTDPSAGQSTVGSSTTSTAKTSSVAAAATKSTMAATSDSFAISPALLLALASVSMLVLGASLYTRRSRKDVMFTGRH